MTDRTIVLGMDGSVGSEAAARWCIEMAPLLDAKVLVVHALPPLLFLVPPTPTGAAAYADEDAVRRGLTLALEEWCAPFRASGIEYESRLVDGLAAETLMRIAGEVHSDLVVVGRRGHGGFAEMILGSVPHTLSHHCDVPVVIVPSEGPS
ncbi:MAG: universal stress protein [Acidimicrobiia bacterium]